MSSTGAKGFRWSTRCTRHPCVTHPVLLAEAIGAPSTSIRCTAQGSGQRMPLQSTYGSGAKKAWVAVGPKPPSSNVELHG